MATRKVTLTYPEQLIREPLLFRMVKQFDVMPNIRRARVTDSVAEMVVELEGDETALEGGVNYLREQGVQVAPVEGDIVGA
ncbi:MAG: NIL domain-containing protein [Armatimonadota bacterium]